MRAHDAEHGGVAVYAKHHISRRITIVKDLPEYGMVWIKIKSACMGGKRDLFVCTCYLPPRSSTYYTKEDDNLSLSAHFDILDNCAAEFRALGEVIITGDLNSRTGCVDERGSLIEREEWEHIGAPAPAELMQERGLVQSIAMRNSSDTVCDSDMGKRLIKFCQDHCMIILNGRLPGDETGSYTFHADGREAFSLVDYFISTPTLVFDEEGGAKSGSFLNVINKWAVPKSPCGGNFDHSPVMLRISTGGASEEREVKRNKGCRERASKGAGNISYRWNDSNHERYATCLKDDTEVRNLLDKIISSQSVLDAEHSLYEAVKTAIAKCDSQNTDKQLLMTVPTGRVKSHNDNLTCNMWYDDECRSARTQYREAERQHGLDSTQARAALVAYKKITKHTRRTWEKDNFTTLHDSLFRDPKRFWSTYASTKPVGDSHDIETWTRYFEALFKYAEPDATEVIDPTMQALLFPLADATAQQRAAALNTEILPSEVKEALETAAKGKAAGTDGVPMDFFKFAFMPAKKATEHILTKHLTYLLNRVLGEQYLDNTTSALVPVPKPKGSASNLDDHRGIAVGSALAKLYSIILLKRLDKWAEGNGMRAKGQAGFRNGRGTLDNAFVLNHLIEKYRAKKKPLYAAFIDFRKAYDSIDRSRLWDCLRGMGINGRILDSLMEMYREVTMAVRVRGELGPEFHANMGVKQGDPLSPLLFGLFIDRIESVFSNILPGVGIQMGNMLVQVLLYADDLVLVAESPAQLQSMLDVLQNFCACNSLTVNVKKSEVVVFNKQHHQPDAGEVHLVYKGQPLVVSPHFVYLGFQFDGKGLGNCIDRNSKKGDAARFAMIRRCYQLGINNVSLKLHLYDALVKPVVNYGCELWGPGLLHMGENYMGGTRGDLEKKHISFLRSTLGVRRSTPTAALMEELQREPLAFAWIRQTVRFWNQILAREDGDVVKAAMLDNIDMARSGRNCWARQLQKCVARDAGVDIFNHTATPLCVTSIMTKVAYKLQQGHLVAMPDVTANNPASLVRSVPDEVGGRPVKGFKHYTYSKWFSPDTVDKHTTFWHNLSIFKHIQTVAQFRLGVHWLNIEWGRFHKQPRSLRLCTCCDMSDREDELHFLTCPMYFNIRAEHGHIFSDCTGQSHGRIPLSIDVNEVTDAEVCGFMNPPLLEEQVQYQVFWLDFARYLYRCKEKRRHYIDWCAKNDHDFSAFNLPDNLDF